MNALTRNAGFILIAAFLVMSLVLFLVMGHDKRLSKTRRRRVPESALFLLALLGGAMGGVIGMQAFRHKTQHMNFVIGFPFIALIQWGAAIWLLLPD